MTVSFFIAERGSRLTGRKDQQSHTDSGLDCTGRNTLMIFRGHGPNISFLRFIDLRWWPAVDNDWSNIGVILLPDGRRGNLSRCMKGVVPMFYWRKCLYREILCTFPNQIRSPDVNDGALIATLLDSNMNSSIIEVWLSNELPACFYHLKY